MFVRNCENISYLQYLYGEIVVEEEFLIDNVGQVEGQISQLQVFSQLKVRLSIRVDNFINLGQVKGQIRQPKVPIHPTA